MPTDLPKTPSLVHRCNPFYLGLFLVMLAGVAQICIVTAAWHGWPLYTDYYRRLTDAFLHHQISLRMRPAPALLAMKNPYDPNANGQYRLHDAVLFDGKYYFYWGPVPALLAAVVCLAMRVSDPSFGDQYLVFAFLFGAVLMATVLIFQARKTLFPQLPPTVSVLPVLSLALGAPVLFMLARAAIYEAAIAAGQFFLMAGIAAAWFGLRDRRAMLLGAAGVSWALSIGSRVSLLPAVAIIAILTIWQLRDGRRGKWIGSAAVVAPLLIGVVLLGWYNHARFHSVAEPGWRYQLSARDQHDVPASSLASWRYVIPDLAFYLFTPPYRIKLFPYVLSFPDWPSWEKMFHLTPAFNFENVVGLAWSQPFLIFAAVAVILPIWKKPPLHQWLILSLCAGAFLGFAPPLTLAGVTMRYLVDIVPCCTVLAAVGYFEAAAKLSGHGRWWREIRSVASLLVLGQCVMGLLLGVTGYYAHFANYSGPVYGTLRRVLPALNF
jgi:hypothetical protein